MRQEHSGSREDWLRAPYTHSSHTEAVKHSHGMFFGGRRKPVDPEETHMDMRRTHDRKTDADSRQTQGKDRTSDQEL